MLALMQETKEKSLNTLSETASRFLDKSNFNILINCEDDSLCSFEEFAYLPLN